MESTDFGKLIASNKTKGHIASFSLCEGLNTVGRAVQEHKSSIELFGDEYMGRLHFSIDVCKDNFGRVHYTLYDNNSTNGTFIKCIATKVQKRLGPEDRIKIEKGDQIKAGNTYFEIEPPVTTKEPKKQDDTNVSYTPSGQK